MKYKFGFFPYTPLDYKAAQDYLDHKAAQGWVLRRLLLGYLAQFEPAQGRRHFVDVCSYASFGANYDYIQLCSDAGWELIPPTDLHYMVIFRSKLGVDPQSIQSDPNFEWKEFFRKQVFQRLIFAGLYCLLFWLPELVTGDFYSWAELAALPGSPLLMLGVILTATACPWQLFHIISYLFQCRRLGKMAPQRWRPNYLRSTLNFCFALVLMVLLCAATVSAFSLL